MFNLNDTNEFSGGNPVFNSAQAGLVKNVTISVEKKQSSDAENSPDYKLLVSDGKASINDGFYYNPKGYESMSEDELNRKHKLQISRIRSIAVAVMGQDYEFPEVSSAKEAVDVLFKLIRDNAGDKKFNVYTTYGTVSYPRQYLQLRYFDFIEPAEMDGATLRPKAADLLKRIEADSASDSSTSEDSGDDGWI